MRKEELEALAPGGVRIRYGSHGQGEPALLFLPPWCASRSAFGETPLRSAAHRRVLTLDWRGHGQSEAPARDFGAAELVEDALAVIAASGVRQVIPVSCSHAGWVALELRRRLGSRVPRIVLTDWMLVEPPAPYLALVEALAGAATWKQARAQLFDLWLKGVDHPEVIRLVREEMNAYGAAMWMRSGREIGAGYARWKSPLEAMAGMRPAPPILHLYTQTSSPAMVADQEAFATEHPWFQVRKLEATSHFPGLEVPEALATAIESFIQEEET